MIENDVLWSYHLIEPGTLYTKMKIISWSRKNYASILRKEIIYQNITLYIFKKNAKTVTSANCFAYRTVGFSSNFFIKKNSSIVIRTGEFIMKPKPLLISDWQKNASQTAYIPSLLGPPSISYNIISYKQKQIWVRCY